jgi:hypothetical protein
MSLRNRAALPVVLSALLTPLAASAGADGSADATQGTTQDLPFAFDEKQDFELHDAHVKAVEERVNAAEAFAPSMMKRATDAKLSLKSYVEDAKYLAELDQPASPELVADLEKKHQGTIKGVESSLGLPGLFGTMQGGSSPPIVFEPLGGSLDAGACGECEKFVFDAPFSGYFTKTFPLGWAAISPEPVWGLTVDFRSGVAGAGHTVAVTGERFTAAPGQRRGAASATMNLSTDVGVGGLGVAHGWSDVQFVVKDVATGAEQCRSRLETSNLAAGAWYAREVRDHGEITVGCRFDRDPSSATTYNALIELRAYGTYAGLVGGHSVIHADFKRIDVELCP